MRLGKRAGDGLHLEILVQDWQTFRIWMGGRLDFLHFCLNAILECVCLCMYWVVLDGNFISKLVFIVSPVLPLLIFPLLLPLTPPTTCISRMSYFTPFTIKDTNTLKTSINHPGLHERHGE